MFSIALNSEKFIEELENVPLEVIEYWNKIIPDDHELTVSTSIDGHSVINFYHLVKLEYRKEGWAYQDHMLAKKYKGKLSVLLEVDSEEPRYYEVNKAIKLLRLKAFW